jgi:LPXTG-motif cell wall-anchored protein
MVVLTIVAVLVAMAATAGSAMAQNDDKAAKRAAKQANKQASRAAKQANKQAQNIQNPGPANAGTQKALPSSGGISAGNIALLGAGALMVGGGLLVHRVARQ